VLCNYTAYRYRQAYATLRTLINRFKVKTLFLDAGNLLTYTYALQREMLIDFETLV